MCCTNANEVDEENRRRHQRWTRAHVPARGTVDRSFRWRVGLIRGDSDCRKLRNTMISAEEAPLQTVLRDGYAVVASDGSGESRAGNDGVGVIVTRTVAYVTTGGPIPDGVDAVVQVEDTEEIKDGNVNFRRVRILARTSKGVDIRSVVYRTPTIVVLSTGDELVHPTVQCLNRGQQQCKVIDLGIARDDEEELEKILDNAFSAGIDILITSGGVSMGDKDFVKPLLEERRTVHFSKVCMKPGKPLPFSEISLKPVENMMVNKTLAFGLPGNPVSCLVCFHLFIVPTICHLSGWENPHLLRVQARLFQPLKTVRPEFHRAIIRWKSNDGSGNPGFVAESTSHQMSGRLLSMKSANALLELPAGGSLISAGTSVSAITISDFSSTGVIETGLGSVLASTMKGSTTKEAIENILSKGTTLKEYMKGVENDLCQVEDYIKESDNLVSLHDQIRNGDATVTRWRLFGGFQVC
ncbi:hypothetical protein Patl1_07167 [Pistacia atlantica]|uniref:Uncharacterized protein n=1 Tax=Pistacia atlantica TaxID=434234 RepID=A0ACC1AJR5_9ROSI|nr:hypothetical protein Patl1_07167 [Pistacia atlantica]